MKTTLLFGIGAPEWVIMAILFAILLFIGWSLYRIFRWLFRS